MSFKGEMKMNKDELYAKVDAINMDIENIAESLTELSSMIDGMDD